MWWGGLTSHSQCQCMFKSILSLSGLDGGLGYTHSHSQQWIVCMLTIHSQWKWVWFSPQHSLSQECQLGAQVLVISGLRRNGECWGPAFSLAMWVHHSSFSVAMMMGLSSANILNSHSFSSIATMIVQPLWFSVDMSAHRPFSVNMSDGSPHS